MTDKYIAYLEETVHNLSTENDKLIQQRNWLIQEMEKAGCMLISLPGIEPVVENVKAVDIISKLYNILPDTKVKEIINDHSNK